MAYRRFEIPKKSGGMRVIEAPDKELKAKQRVMLEKFTSTLWVSRKAHGFKRGKSIYTNAMAHCVNPKRFIANFDIKDFFTSLKERSLSVVLLNKNEEGVARNMDRNDILHNGSLPQGAPTSPFLSNVAMRKFDTTIAPLLRKYVSSDIEYTRYGDDMTFTSNSKAIKKVGEFLKSKLRPMGLKLNNEKTRIAGPGARHEVTGLNINSGRPTVPKKYRHKVRAIIHRIKYGWVVTEKQHKKLAGMISHIALCHKEEAAKYLAVLKNTKPIANTSRMIAGVSRVKLQVGSQLRGHRVAHTHNVNSTNRHSHRKIVHLHREEL